MLRGVNMSSVSAYRTAVDVNRIQRVAFESCLWLSQSLAAPISTKLHRSMRHVADALFKFRCSRRGDSNDNETLHKDTKCSIPASNRKIEQMASKFVLNRSIANVITEGTNALQSTTNEVQNELQSDYDDFNSSSTLSCSTDEDNAQIPSDNP
eukprot:IDg5590t1